MKVPCEIIICNVLPIIIKEFVKNLIKAHNFTQRTAADKLVITETAVSRYMSRKRGILEISIERISKEIKKFTYKIVKGNNKLVIKEIFRICRIIKSEEFIKGIRYASE